MTIELTEWEANYLLDYLDEQADYDFRGPDPRVRQLRDKLAREFQSSGVRRLDLAQS